MPKPQLFTADQFIPTQYDTAEQKAKFANHFVRFVESDFKSSLFFDWFYTRLSMTFHHIANFSGYGFYQTWFQTTQSRLEFLHHTVNYGTHPMSDPTSTYCDVERALIEWLIKSPHLAKYQAKVNEELERNDRAELARLQAKYG